MFSQVWSNAFDSLGICQLRDHDVESVSEDSEGLNNSSMDYQVLRTHPLYVWMVQRWLVQ